MTRSKLCDLVEIKVDFKVRLTHIQVQLGKLRQGCFSRGSCIPVGLGNRDQSRMMCAKQWACICAWHFNWWVLCKSVAGAVSCSSCFLTSAAPPPQLAACRLDVAKRSVWANQHRVSKLFRICCQNLRIRFFTGKSGFLALFENWESSNPLPPPTPFPTGPVVSRIWRLPLRRVECTGSLSH